MVMTAHFNVPEAVRLGAKLPKAVLEAYEAFTEAQAYTTEPDLPAISLDSSDAEILAYIAADKRLAMWERVGQKKDKAVKAKAGAALTKAINDHYQDCIDALCGAANKMIKAKNFDPSAIADFDQVCAMLDSMVSNIVMELKIPLTRMPVITYDPYKDVARVVDGGLRQLFPIDILREPSFWFVGDSPSEKLLKGNRPDYIHCVAMKAEIQLPNVAEHVKEFAFNTVKAAHAEIDRFSDISDGGKGILDAIDWQMERGYASWADGRIV
ncbi:hypothetical protein [Glycomyces arizonensis]|uniref:hypothetical protein n=1 Tax=Glycomyces arizonensis TaxID=256035 RepID=UPI0004792106|nr:hypothetical protein [Glycomyces arizonensis]